MRAALFACAMACLLLSAPRVHAATVGSSNAPAISAASAPTFALQEPEKKIDITVNRGGGWYRSPTWIAIGVLAVVVLVLIVAMIARGGGGTTIVKD